MMGWAGSLDSIEEYVYTPDYGITVAVGDRVFIKRDAAVRPGAEAIVIRLLDGMAEVQFDDGALMLYAPQSLRKTFARLCDIIPRPYDPKELSVGHMKHGFSSLSDYFVGEGKMTRFLDGHTSQTGFVIQPFLGLEIGAVVEVSDDPKAMTGYDNWLLTVKSYYRVGLDPRVIVNELDRADGDFGVLPQDGVTKTQIVTLTIAVNDDTSRRRKIASREHR